MTTSGPKDGSSSPDPDPDPASTPPGHQPSGTLSVGGEVGVGPGKDAIQVAEQQAQAPAPGGRGPWWRTRAAYIWFATAAALLLVTFVVLLVLGLLGYLTKHGHRDPHINLGYATYVGTTVNGSINRFLGMRYAAAPVGDLRWRAPAPPPTSTTPQQAKEFGPICLGISAAYPSSSEDEDCLFVNVWAPRGAGATSRLPVWLFIQGGGYVSNSNANWDGEEVVRASGNGIVFVNFNYRVSLWGFLASSRVRADGALNAGLLDQRCLMRWVRTHIAAFGGDPDGVVIHGASAGAGSVALHLTAYGGRDEGLFAAAIAESVFFPAQPPVAQLEYQFDRVARGAGCAGAPAPDQLACLRALGAGALQALNVPSAFPGRTAAPLPHFYWTPCVDGDLVRDLPYGLLARGRFVRGVPLLLGNDDDEGSYFAADAADAAAMANFLRNNYPLLTAADARAVVDMYPPGPPAPRHRAWFPPTSRAYGEATFICPAMSILGAYNSSSSTGGGGDDDDDDDDDDEGTRLWLYRYAVVDDDNAAAGLGVPHLWESYAVFGPSSLGGGGGSVPASYLTYNAPVVPVVMGYFLSFVRTRDPNTLRAPGAPLWGAWGAPGAGGNGSRIVIETNNTRMEDVGPALAARCEFWAGLAPRTQQKKKRGEASDLWG